MIERLVSARDLRTISVIAPPGYGKTTALTQFANERPGPTAWLTLEDSDNDPATLLSNLIQSLRNAGLVDQSRAPSPSLQPDHLLTRGLTALVRAIPQDRKGVLILDQVDHVSSQSSLDLIGAILTKVAGPIQVVIASRVGNELPLALLRSQGSVHEITTSDLAMNLEEAAAVFDSTGVDPADNLGAVMKQTEGWPAGIYLTAMAIRAGGRPFAEVAVHGSDFYLADYLREELLDRAPEHLISFLRRSALLSRLAGPLCDFVLETEGSAAILAELEHANLLIVPMDRTRTWYRYHTLLREYLLSDLEKSAPGQAASLHARAADWFDRHGFPDLAMSHLQAAGAATDVGRMFMQHARRVFGEGRRGTALAWVNWLDENRGFEGFPELAAFGAYARCVVGDAGGAERIAVFAFHDTEGRPLEDEELGPYARLLRSFQWTRGVDQAAADARAAVTGFLAIPDFLHVAQGVEALVVAATDGAVAADPLWAEALWRSEALDAHPFITYALAQRALVRIELGDWEEASDLIRRSVARIDSEQLDEAITSPLGLALAARLAAREGDLAAAQALMSRAASGRPTLSFAAPGLAVHTLVEMSKAYLELADVAGARRVLRDAADIIAVRPRLGLLVGQFTELKEKLASLPAGTVGPSTLTNAELRLLPLLVTHLTYPEMGERLFVSRHTVKTQAMSIYRKLGVTSRNEAVSKAREIGLLSA